MTDNKKPEVIEVWTSLKTKLLTWSWLGKKSNKEVIRLNNKLQVENQQLEKDKQLLLKRVRELWEFRG